MKYIYGILLLSLSLINLSCTTTSPEVKPTSDIVNTTESTSNQENIASLKAALESYKKILISGDLEKSLDYAYPPIFQITPKKELVKSLKIIKKSPNAPKITTLEQNPTFPLKTYTKGVYTSVFFTIYMEMNATPPIPKNNAEKAAKIKAMLKNPDALEKYKRFMIDMLAKSLGSDADITSKKGSLIIKIKKPSSYIAINEENTGWKFIDILPMTMEEAQKILPKKIADELNRMVKEKQKNTYKK